MVSEDIERRRLMKALATAGITGVAGCMGGDDGGAEGNETPTATETATSNDDSGPQETEEEREVGNKDASIQFDFAGWGSGKERDVVEGMLREYADKQGDIAINYQSIPFEEYHDRLRTQFGASEEPDLFYMDMAFVSTFAQSDVLLELEEPLPDDFIADFDQNVLNAFAPRREEGLYYLPKDFQVLASFYNKELFAEAGYEEFPETWNEFRSALQAIKENTNVDYPMLESGSGNSAAWIWYPWMYGNGGQVMNDDRSECVVASDEAVEALEFFQSLRENELIGTADEIGAAWDVPALAKEQVAMVTGGGWIPSTLMSDHSDTFEVLGTARPPRAEDTEFGNLIFGAGYSISARTEYQETALGLIQYLMGEGIKPWLESGIALSIRKSQREGFVDLYEEHDHWSKMFEMTEDRLGTWEFGPHTEEIFNTLTPQLEGVIQGEVEARDALETAQNKINTEVLE